MEYLLKLATMNGQVKVSITMFAENHFGLQMRDGTIQTSYKDANDKLIPSYYYRIKAFNFFLTVEYTKPILVQNLTIVGIQEQFSSNDF